MHISLFQSAPHHRQFHAIVNRTGLQTVGDGLLVKTVYLRRNQGHIGLDSRLLLIPIDKAVPYRCQFILLNHSAVCFNPRANVKGGFHPSSFLIFEESTAREPVSLLISCDFPVMKPARLSINIGR